MRELILNILPEIREIQDEELHEQVIACWTEAMLFRGWTEELLRSIPFTLLAEDVQISFIDHVRAVCRICMAVNDVLTQSHGKNKTPVNRDVLIAGALLADVGKLYEYEIRDLQVSKSEFGKYLRHPFSGVGLAFKHELPPEVMHVIATHSKEGEGEKRSPEATIFHHADFIDFELVK
ncbi:HD domain-containing protein [candidate division KSB1 bacterium]|nr:HD domain-containing protein [candidate division KSB1 bacterium]